MCFQHDGIRKEDGWFLQEVEIVNTKRKKSWLFMCNTWLSLHHTDGHSKREFFPHLGSKTGALVKVLSSIQTLKLCNFVESKVISQRETTLCF